MALMKELYFIFYINLTNSEVFCKAFEENQTCIAVVEFKTISPRTKHIAINYQHFRRFVQKKFIRICYIDTREQTTEIFTKPLDKALLIYVLRKLSG